MTVCSLIINLHWISICRDNPVAFGNQKSTPLMTTDGKAEHCSCCFWFLQTLLDNVLLMSSEHWKQHQENTCGLHSFAFQLCRLAWDESHGGVSVASEWLLSHHTSNPALRNINSCRRRRPPLREIFLTKGWCDSFAPRDDYKVNYWCPEIKWSVLWQTEVFPEMQAAPCKQWHEFAQEE